jgi:amino acid transporter
MMAEMGSAYRREEGGIYSWMNHSVGPRFAFIGTFMWFASYVVWMVSTAAKMGAVIHLCLARTKPRPGRWLA